MRKLLIGMIAACVFAVGAVSASAAIPKRAVVKTKDFIAKTGKSLGSAIWDNKVAMESELTLQGCGGFCMRLLSLVLLLVTIVLPGGLLVAQPAACVQRWVQKSVGDLRSFPPCNIVSRRGPTP